MTLDAIEKVFERVEAEVRTRGSWVEGSFVVVGFWLQRRSRIVMVMAGHICRVGTRTEDVSVGVQGSHLWLWEWDGIPGSCTGRRLMTVRVCFVLLVMWRQVRGICGAEDSVD